MIEACRNLLQAVSNQDHGAIRTFLADTAQCAHHLLAAAQVKAGGRLIHDEQLGISHQRTGDQYAGAFAFGQSPHLLAFQIGDAKITQQLAGAGIFLVRISITPAPSHGGQAGDHGVQRVLELRELPAQVGRGETDAGAQLEYVVFAELVAENEHAAFRGEGAGGQHADRGGFADAVRTEQHPTLPRVDGEVHVGDNDTTVTPEFDVVELEDGVCHE